MTISLIASLFATAVFAFLWWRIRGEQQADRAALKIQNIKDADFLRRMQRRAELLHRLVDGIDDGLFIIGGDMRVIFVNLGAQYFFPPVTEPVGRSLLECVPNQRILEIVERSFTSRQKVSEGIMVLFLEDLR